MSFGFSIGDFLAVIELVNKVRKDFSAAPEEYQAIAAEVRSFSLVLQDIDVYLSSHDISEAQQKNLDDVIANSFKTLRDIETAIAKFSTLESRPSGLREHSRRIWQRVRWEPEDVRDLRSRIISTVSLLGTLADGFHRTDLATLTATTVKLVEKEQLQASQEILDWLATTEYAAQHEIHRRQRIAGTGEWLLNSAAFKKWVGSAGDSDLSASLEQRGLQFEIRLSEVILLHGIPGAGKTVLASMCIDHLQKSHGGEGVAICYYYCDYSRQKDQTPENLFTSLLRQLAQHLNTGLPSSLAEMFSSHRRSGTRPSLSEIREALTLVAESFQTIYVIVDALDECRSSDSSRRIVISELLSFSKTTGHRILLTSRPLPDITNFFDKSELMEIRASAADISKLVAASMPSLPNFVVRSSSLQDEIGKAIVTSADGVFLLATLYLQALQGSRSRRTVQSALNSFSKGTSGYTEAYSNTMKRITSQVVDQKELAIDALMWVTFAERTLTSDELLHALATILNEPDFPEDNIPDIEDVISACCGLLIVETDTKLVRLVHRTTQEYLKDNRSLWFAQVQNKMSKICDAYLSYVDNSRKDGHDQSDQFPFYNYASWHGVQHAKMRESPMTMDELVATETHLELSEHLHENQVVSEYLDLSLQNPGLTGLHLLAYYGANKLIPHFLERYDINSTDKFRYTPIFHAVRQDHTKTVKLLIRHGAKVDVLDAVCRSPLHHAVLQQSENVNKYVVARTAMISDSSKKTLAAIQRAIKEISSATTDVLLSHGADASIPDQNGRTPISYAAGTMGYFAKELLEHLLAKTFKSFDLDPMRLGNRSSTLRSMVHQPDNEGLAPIMHAAKPRWGSDVNVSILLDYAADANSSDKQQRSVLSWIAQNETPYTTLAQRLLENGARIDQEDADGRTPLSYAVCGPTTELVALLLDNGAKINHSDTIRGFTPLLYATENHRTETVDLLLTRGADMNVFDGNGQSALSMAALELRVDIVKLLLQHGVDVNAADRMARTPLHMAAIRADIQPFDALLAAGADSNARDIRGTSILEYASTSGTMELLMRVLAIPEFEALPGSDALTWTALHRACLQGTFKMLLLLAKLGIKMITVETKEPLATWAPLDLAIYWGNTNLVTAQGSLRQDISWTELVDSGLVTASPSSTIAPFRANALTPANSHGGFSCDICGVEISGLRFNCVECEDFDLCVLCNTDADIVHPQHNFKALEPENDDDSNDDGDDDGDNSAGNDGDEDTDETPAA